MQIGFYDSGIGGINVLHDALEKLPNENFIYYADTQHVPYGTKPKDEVKKYIFEAVDFISQQEVKALVIACNTATIVAVNELRQKYSFPIIGMEPAIKPAVELNRNSNKRVLVLATPLALKEDKFHKLLQRVDNDHLVDLLPAPGLVDYAENLVFNEDILLKYLAELFSSFDIENYSTIVLGCTHFLYYKNIFRKFLPDNIKIIDGNAGTVNNLKRILKEKHNINEGNGKITYYKSGRKIENEDELYNFKLLQDMIR